MKKAIFASTLILLFLTGSRVRAAQLGESLSFNIDDSYDLSGRSRVEAVLVKITPELYFYLEKDWWENQNQARQKELVASLEDLGQEFTNRIYPALTSVFGSEWKPGIDGEERITVLFHQMRGGAGGYFRTDDEYLKIQSPASNEREMLYLALASLDQPQVEAFLAHEFVHLITFNQKERQFNVSEEIWLNEARAEYAGALLGYNDSYPGSLLEQRVKAFLEEPFDSVTEWKGKKADYGALTLLTHYLAEHYGIGILSDSLRSSKVGIPSLDEALGQNGFSQDFAEVFTDWSIATLVNDCGLGQRYCYLNQALKELRVSPNLNFLPLVGESILSLTDVTKNWSANWHKFIGGQGRLSLEFKTLKGLDFRLPYLFELGDGQHSLSFLKLTSEASGEIVISGFGAEAKSVILIPSLQSKKMGFNGIEATYPFSLTASLEKTNSREEEAELIRGLLSQIEFLKREIARVQIEIEQILARKKSFACSAINNSLSYASRNSAVACLQEFLKAQGPEIYPEGLITGYFGPLTLRAVIRFQEKYADEILAPWGREQGTGFVGRTTLAKINALWGK